MDKEFKYQEKKKKELDWWESNHSCQSNDTFLQNLFHSKLFWDKYRNLYAYDVGKRRMSLFIKNQLNKKEDKLLLAPVGNGDDYKYVKDYANEIYGIDLSPRAIDLCKQKYNDKIITKVADILNNGYPDKYFDIIVSSLFFHHVSSIGFRPFLREFHRLLKKGGLLVILDFSIYYPLNALTRPLKRLFKNPYGEVEGESPFRPKTMIRSLDDTDYSKITIKGANFSHCSFPIPIAKVFNKITFPLLDNNILNKFSWLVLFGATK